MHEIARLRNPIRRYSWGSRTAIAELQGRGPAAEPEAELWMGTHPLAPSEVEVGGRWVPLPELVAGAPGELLGAAVAARFGELPFLMKVLAAAEPLSIQVHPDRRQAERGCRREDALGLARDAAERNYRDGGHKPELIYALTPFTLLRGFRPPAEIHARLERAGVADLLPHARELATGGSPALERFFAAWMSLPVERLEPALAHALSWADEGDEDAAVDGDDGDDPADPDARRWLRELARRHPGDRGVLAPLVLELATLQPGEAVYTPAGVLHAYLEGTGVELMASSDNVLRGGLTPKHVDVAELLRVVRCEPEAVRPLAPRAEGAARRFAVPAEEFALTVIELDGGSPYRHRGGRPGILLATAGEGQIEAPSPVDFRRGDSFFVPASVAGWSVGGRATLFLAETGDL